MSDQSKAAVSAIRTDALEAALTEALDHLQRIVADRKGGEHTSGEQQNNLRAARRFLRENGRG